MFFSVLHDRTSALDHRSATIVAGTSTKDTDQRHYFSKSLCLKRPNIRLKELWYHVKFFLLLLFKLIDNDEKYSKKTDMYDNYLVLSLILQEKLIM